MPGTLAYSLRPLTAGSKQGWGCGESCGCQGRGLRWQLPCQVGLRCEPPGHTSGARLGADPLQEEPKQPQAAQDSSLSSRSLQRSDSLPHPRHLGWEDPGDTSGLLFMWTFWVTPSAGLGCGGQLPKGSQQYTQKLRSWK